MFSLRLEVAGFKGEQNMKNRTIIVETVVKTRSGLKIRKQEIQVNEEVYKAMMRPEWREKKRIQRAYRDKNFLWNQYENGEISDLPDSSKEFKAMNGNGEVISQLRMGLPLSLEQINEITHFQVQESKDVESAFQNKLIWDAFYQTLSSFKQRDQLIMELSLVDQLSEREIALRVGCSQKTVNNVKKRLIPILQNELKDWR